LSGALLFVEKICQRAAFWFGLRDVLILQIFYSQVAIQRTIVDFPAFLKYNSAEKIVVCPIQTVIRTSRRLDSFLYESGSELSSLFKNSKLQLKNQKPITVDAFFMAYPIKPLSCRSNMAGWSLSGLLHSVRF
jgi:hypothetical protein